MSDEPSGRELDVALAEALGWKVQGCDCGNADCGKQYVAASPEAPTWAHGEKIPCFSENDWPLVTEAMRQNGWQVDIQMFPDKMIPDKAAYYCRFVEHGDETEAEAVADTPGAAVGLAAYRALRAEEET